MAKLRRVPPASLEDLKLTVEAFAQSMDKEEVIKSVRHIRDRAKVCSHMHGYAFESKLKKLRKQLRSEE